MDVTAETLSGMLAEAMPHARALGIEFVGLDDTTVTLRLAEQPHFICNKEAGVVHGGVITTLLDSASGVAIFAKIGRFEPMATLDLRIDYLRPSTPGQAITVSATCFKATRNIAFVRGLAYHQDPDNAIAHSVGSFILATRGQSMYETATAS